MPADPQQARNMLLSTDYPTDKIIYKMTGSVTVATGASNDNYFPHGLPFTPLLTGTWSYDADFTTSYMAGQQPFADPNSSQVTVQSNATNARVLVANNTGSTKTIYWRIYGIMPPNVDVDSVFTASQLDSFIMNTNYNYTKTYMEGYVDISGGTQAITHNLGYRPQVEIWFELASVAGQFEREYLGMADSGDTFYQRTYVTPTQLIFNKGTGGGLVTKFYYKIFLDE
jgi:hypothetical protein